MDWTGRVRAVFIDAPRIPDDDVIDELAQHASAMYEAARADGCAHDEAHRRVAGQLAVWRAEAHALRHPSDRPPVVEPPPAVSPSRFTGVMQDVRYAARLLRRQPRPALITILTVALAIGATTMLFSVAYGVLMKPLPWPHSDRIVVLKETRGGGAPRFGEFSSAAYLAWREAGTIEGIAAWSRRVVTLSGAGEPERIRITAATASLFPVLGVRPLIGALFEQKDEASPVIVLSESLWRQRFGGDPRVLGALIHLDGRPYSVIGVLSDDLAYPDRQARAVVPYRIGPTAGNELLMFSAIAALRPTATAAQAAAEGTARARFAPNTGLTTVAIFGSNGPAEVSAQPLGPALTADVRRPLIVLSVAVGLLLLTATANVGSLQLARSITRTREMAIRAALGAGRARVMRQLLVESLLLGLTGGAGGLAFTWLLHRSMPPLLPADFPRVDDLGVDATVAAFALVVSVGTSIVAGLFPVLRVGGLHLVEALAEDGTAPVGAGLRTRTARTRTLVMAGQVAIACVLLVSASLLGRSFLTLIRADRGYDPSDILSARLSMPVTIYPAAERRFAIVEEVLTRLSGTPGVTEVAFTSELPLTPGGSTSAFNLKARHPNGAAVNVQASPRIVSPRYFSALRMRLVSGRVFSGEDTETSQPVVVVNQAFARRYLGDSPLGSTLPVTGYAPPDREDLESTVIGVVDNVRYGAAADVSQPELYYSHRQLRGRLPVHTVTLLALTSGDIRAAAAAVRRVVRNADERLVADVVMPLEQRLLTTTLAQPRVYAVLLAGFAAFAVIIAAVGLFGLLSYSVSQRSRELAIRAALGAARVDLFRLVLRQGLGVTLAGIVAGMLASAWSTRLLSTHLYGVSPHDALTFVLVPLLILVFGVLACLVPARRAAGVDAFRVIRGG
jgi:putative ABC transport system permease protein